MDTNCNKKLQHIFILLAVSALLISMIGCASDKKPRVKRSDASGDEPVAEEPSKDVVVVQNNPTNGSTTGTAPKSNTSSPTTKASANVFEGTWDVDFNGTFFNWTFGYASKSQSGDKLEGKITDSSNAVIGEYTVLPNKTVELNIYSGSSPTIVPYKISNGGNQIEVIDGTTKVILTKGKTNTTIQNDGNILASKLWRNVNNPSEQIEFLSVRKSSSGWNGTVTLIGGSASASGTFSLSPGKLTTTINGSVDNYTYKLRNNNTTLDLTDSGGNTETYN